jgi:hypothetical protein
MSINETRQHGLAAQVNLGCARRRKIQYIVVAADRKKSAASNCDCFGARRVVLESCFV